MGSACGCTCAESMFCTLISLMLGFVDNGDLAKYGINGMRDEEGMMYWCGLPEAGQSAHTSALCTRCSP